MKIYYLHSGKQRDSIDSTRVYKFKANHKKIWSLFICSLALLRCVSAISLIYLLYVPVRFGIRFILVHFRFVLISVSISERLSLCTTVTFCVGYDIVTRLTGSVDCNIDLVLFVIALGLCYSIDSSPTCRIPSCPHLKFMNELMSLHLQLLHITF